MLLEEVESPYDRLRYPPFGTHTPNFPPGIIGECFKFVNVVFAVDPNEVAP